MIKERQITKDILFKTSPNKVRLLYTLDPRIQSRGGQPFIAQSFIDGKTIGPDEVSYWDD